MQAGLISLLVLVLLMSPLRYSKKYASSKKGFSQLFVLAGVTLINYLPLLLYDAGKAVLEFAGKYERLAIS